MIYLDYAANYPVKKEVIDTLYETELLNIGNANSLHKEGVKSKEALDKIEQKIKDILNLDSNKELIYTSSATEANNLAIKGYAKAYSSFGRHILVSPFEHSSVNAALSRLKDEGFEIEFLNVNQDGKINLDDLKQKLRNDTILVVVMFVESECGQIQDYKKIYETIKQNSKAKFLCDATQGISKFEFDFNYTDMAVFSPHKFGGLTGTGVLVKNKDTILIPQISGGKSNTIYRAGSIPVGLISTIYKSLEIAYYNMSENFDYVKSLHQYFINELKNNKGVIINSFFNPYIINISIKNKKASDVVKYLDQNDFCVSQKSACSLTNTPSKTIMAIYHDRQRANSSFRISISDLTKKEELEKLIDALR